MPSIAEAVQALRPADENSAIYLSYHQRRYAFLFQCLQRVLQARQAAEPTEPLRFLDVGMSYQTLLLRELYPAAEIEILGYFDHRFSALEDLRHTHYDLNQAADTASWPAIGPFDVILFAEVIEHLYVTPSKVLRLLRSLLRPGGTIVIQTPNPVNLSRRLALLGGKSPFEIIRDDPFNPGHFCEYTIEQLVYLAGLTEFDVTGYWLKNYFGEAGAVKTLYSLACALLPGHLAEGTTITLRRPFVEPA